MTVDRVDPVDQIARAVLYEGYALYPYRPTSLKNRQRFNFGVLYPAAYCDEHSGERAAFVTECPIEGDAITRLEVSVRFLQMSRESAPALPGGEWLAAMERQLPFDGGDLGALKRTGVGLDFECPAAGTDGGHTVRGELRVRCHEVRPGVHRLTVRVANTAAIDRGASRDAALARALVSAHVVLRLAGGAFVSLLDPPAHLHEVAAGCTNVGVWPVLVGEAGDRRCMLASPIVLYDYPRVAPESPGDLFDATEIDEILGLRILTMTDAEKREAVDADERIRHLLARTESLGPERWAKLHGAIRGLRNATKEKP